jgi:DNA-binding protein
LSEETTSKSANNNVLLIGKKPAKSYAAAAMYKMGSENTIIIKARGKAISKAVDVAEIILNKIGNGKYDLGNITIGTITVENENVKRSISTIEITLNKK